MDELDALDASAGAGYGGAFPAVGLQELIGAMEPSGNDFLRMMAAAGAGGVNPALAELAKKMADVRAIDPNAVLVRQQAEDVRREYHIGFDSGPVAVAINASATLTARPQVTFRPERLMVPSFIAPFFTVDNIIVGKDSQTAVGASPVPATMYSEVAVGARLNLKTANLGHDVTLLVTNVDPAAAHRFRAGMIGTSTDVG